MQGQNRFIDRQAKSSKKQSIGHEMVVDGNLAGRSSNGGIKTLDKIIAINNKVLFEITI
jgi:uncharacterized protein YjdB